MTREQATKRARTRWGTKAYIRVNSVASSPEKRADALARMREARERIKAIDAEIAARLAELDWYQALTNERKAIAKNLSVAQGWAMYHKFSVGSLEMGFACIKGSGDTWEEAFAKAEKQ